MYLYLCLKLSGLEFTLDKICKAGRSQGNQSIKMQSSPLPFCVSLGKKGKKGTNKKEQKQDHHVTLIIQGTILVTSTLRRP